MCQRLIIKITTNCVQLSVIYDRKGEVHKNLSADSGRSHQAANHKSSLLLYINHVPSIRAVHMGTFIISDDIWT